VVCLDQPCIKLAPLFAKRNTDQLKRPAKQLSDADKEALHLRQHFLLSGVPDELKRLQNTQPVVVVTESPSWSENIHVQQIQPLLECDLKYNISHSEADSATMFTTRNSKALVTIPSNGCNHNDESKEMGETLNLVIADHQTFNVNSLTNLGSKCPWKMTTIGGNCDFKTEKWVDLTLDAIDLSRKMNSSVISVSIT